MKKSGYVIVAVAAIGVGFSLGRHHSGAASRSQGGRRVLYYVDPMHPSYKSDKPGTAPDCGMALEPVYADDPGIAAAASVARPMPSGSVNIDSDRQQLFGIRTAAVEKYAGSGSLRVPGRVAPEDNRVYRVNSGVEGWVRKIFDDSVGTHVQKDQKLATVYSPDFLSVISGYLASTERGSNIKEGLRGQQAYVDRLRNLGVSEMQISELNQTRQIPEEVYLVSPVDGFILSRNISADELFERRTEFYRIADLDKVWIIADVFGSEAQSFRPGAVARVNLPDQGKSLQAKITNILPEVDPATRTLKLRLEADNPEFRLRPDMFVEVELPVAVPSGLSVPVDAVLDSGVNKRVFVDRGQGWFEPREVVTGWRYGDRIQIVKGVAEGDRVVTSGNFLVDSESRLKSAGSETPASLSPAASKSNQTQAAGRVKDPRCGMEVDPARAKAGGHTLTMHGTTYYFCSKDCKDKFEKEPERYLASNH